MSSLLNFHNNHDFGMGMGVDVIYGLNAVIMVYSEIWRFGAL